MSLCVCEYMCVCAGKCVCVSEWRINDQQRHREGHNGWIENRFIVDLFVILILHILILICILSLIAHQVTWSGVTVQGFISIISCSIQWWRQRDILLCFELFGGSLVSFESFKCCSITAAADLTQTPTVKASRMFMYLQ